MPCVVSRGWWMWILVDQVRKQIDVPYFVIYKIICILATFCFPGCSFAAFRCSYIYIMMQFHVIHYSVCLRHDVFFLLLLMQFILVVGCNLTVQLCAAHRCSSVLFFSMYLQRDVFFVTFDIIYTYRQCNLTVQASEWVGHGRGREEYILLCSYILDVTFAHILGVGMGQQYPVLLLCRYTILAGCNFPADGEIIPDAK